MLLWSEGFDKYSAIANYAVRWVQTGATQSHLPTGGRTGSGAYRNTNYDNFITGTFQFVPPLGSTIHVACWCKLANKNGTGNVIFVRNGTSGRMFILGTTASIGNAMFYITGYGTNSGAFFSIAQEAVSSIVPGQWQHIEIAYRIDGINGFARVWIDGILVINFSGNTLQAGSAVDSPDQIRLGNHQSGSNTDYDDIVVWEGAIAPFAATQLGAHVIESLAATAAGASTQLTPSAGANWENIDDPNEHDGDTTNNSSTAPSQLDLYEYANTALSTGLFLAVVANLVTRSNGAAITMRAVARGSAVNRSSDDIIRTSGTYGHRYWPFYRQPDTLGDWTAAAINAMQLGMEYVSGDTAFLTQLYAEVINSIGTIVVEYSNDLLINWDRRTRLEAEMIDGSNNSPLDEAAELYDLEIMSGPGGTIVRTVAGLTTSQYLYTAALQATDGFSVPLSSLTVRVYQLSADAGRGLFEETTVYPEP